MTLIGVTGGFCAGKTTVSRFFKALGAGVIDADKVVHRLYKNDKKIKRAILRKFGKGVFTPGGKIDRKKLGKTVFANKRKLKCLSRITHPMVIKKIKEKAKRSKKSVTVIDAPLLIEAGLYKLVDFVVVVNAPLKKRVERIARKGFKKHNIGVMRGLQMPFGKKIKYADFVIDNNRSKKYTRKEVARIWKKINEGTTYGGRRPT